MPGRGRKCVELPRKLIVLGWAFVTLSGAMAPADDGLAVTPPAKQGRVKSGCGKEPGHRHGPGCGTSDPGPPGPREGFQGFGLKFHPGYGYGGKALGVGAEGGYPSYGGPGYLHPGPCLNRFGKEKPFTHLGGPGFPTPDHPNFFGEVGPLVLDQPVVEIGPGPGDVDPGGDYGAHTGLLPYPESTLAASTTALGTAGSAAGVGTPVPPGPPLTPPPASPPFAPPSSENSPSTMELEAVVSADGVRCLKVTKIQPGAAAGLAGLRVGDEIRSANDFVTETPGNLTWIITNRAPEDVLRMRVRTASDGQVRTLSMRLR